MLHLDGAALAYRRDEDRVELVQPSSWPHRGDHRRGIRCVVADPAAQARLFAAVRRRRRSRPGGAVTKYEHLLHVSPTRTSTTRSTRSSSRPGQNGSRERGFGTPKYERLYIDEIDDAVMLAKHAEQYRIEYNQIKAHEAIARSWPQEVDLGPPTPTIPTFRATEILPAY